MTRSTRFDIPLVLPGIEDEQDKCVARLVSLLEARNGIERVHVAHGPEESGPDAGKHPDGAPNRSAALCLHYDPERISLAQIN